MRHDSIKRQSDADRWDEENWNNWPWYGKLFFWVLIAIVWLVVEIDELREKWGLIGQS